jgi:predicted SAM-dependent methyltransferase
MQLGLGLHVRAVRLLRRLSRWSRQRPRRVLRRRTVARLHLGCGPQVLPGWVNVDLEYHPGVDLVHDVRDGLPFEGVEYIFAEHFLEHLTYDEGVRFLRECRASLTDGGVLRLSTPNLDWVMRTQYEITPSSPEDARIRACFAMNKAFRGWGHQFLYNAATLVETLHAAGFENTRLQPFGESDHAPLRGLERHETFADSPELPHVIVIEAWGRRPSASASMEAAIDDYDLALHG